jgi:hypothetical protein
MLGEVGIRYTEKPHRVINNNFRNIIALVAPFKDDSFICESYNTLEEAVDAEKTLNAEAKGYGYLELLYKHFPGMPEIVLCNTTTNKSTPETPDYCYEMTNERLGEILEELDEVGISFLVIPEKLTVPQYVMYKAFYDEQRAKMNAFGLFHQVKPTEMSVVDESGNTISETPLLSILFRLEEEERSIAPKGIFVTGGSWWTETTRRKIIDEEPLTMEESVVYSAGEVASTNENVSSTHRILDGVEGFITKHVYGSQAFKLVINSGAIAVNYRDKIHKICQIYNSGTQTWNKKLKNTYDLRHERTHALVINEFRIGMLELAGKDNLPVTCKDFESLGRNIQDKYIPSHAMSIDWKISKSGSAKVKVEIEEKYANIIQWFDVIGTIIIE